MEAAAVLRGAVALERAAGQGNHSTIGENPAAFEMGEIATDLLIQLIESKRPVTDFETKKLAPQLIIRESAKNRKNKVIPLN